MDVLAEPQRLAARVDTLLAECAVSMQQRGEREAGGAQEQRGVESPAPTGTSTGEPAPAAQALPCLAAAEHGHAGGCSSRGRLKVFLDIGGNRELQAVTAVLPLLQRLQVRCAALVAAAPGVL
jgi:hypothetical protein